MHLMDRQAQNSRLAAHEGQVPAMNVASLSNCYSDILRRNYAGHLLGLSPGQ